MSDPQPPVRVASCSCGQLALRCTGEPVRVSLCHCLECQKRTGGPFGAQARYPRDQVEIEGSSTIYTRTGDAGATIEMHFCPRCGSTLYWTIDALEGFVSVAVGNFADPSFAAPTVTVYEARRHPWVEILGDPVRYD